MSVPHVLLLKKGGKEFLYPNEPNGIISMAQGVEFEIHCPGAENYLQDIAGNLKSILAKCVRGKTISWSNLESKDFQNIKCLKHIDSVARRNPVKKCNHNRNDIIEIGFQIERNWLQLLQVCHDSDRSGTLWVRYEMNSPNDGAHKVLRPGNGARSTHFIPGNFYPKVQNVDEAYTVAGSEKSLRRILGDQALNALLLNNARISRGHLAAAGDFVYHRQQETTFHFLNCAPQWASFNNANWNIVEQSIRKMINRINAGNTVVYSGTHGILTRESSELFLAENVTGGEIQRRIPIPKLFFKIVIMPKLRQGIVFIGVNDLQATSAQLNSEYRLCENVIGRLNPQYVKAEKLKEVQKGFIYACDVESFMTGLKTVKMDTLPSDIPTNLGLIT